jgi:photosystem II stability/assembly factor-like uncharacterized protein
MRDCSVLSAERLAWQKPEGTLETLYWAITCVDAQTAWVVGQDREGAPVVRATVDGGTTWKSQDPDVSVPSNETACALLGADFLDALNGCAVGKLGSVTVTHDGGETWQSVGGSIDNGLSGVVYASETQLWVVGGLGTILGSEDGGETWSDQSPDSTMLNGMHLGDLRGVAVPPAATPD